MKRILVAALALAAAACGDKKGNVTVSAQTAQVSGETAPTTIQSGAVTISRIRLLIRRLELETVAAAGDLDDSHGDDTCELRAGPFVLDLQGEELNGAIHAVFDAEVTPGTYREIEFKIHKLTGHEQVEDPDFADRATSVIVDGTLSDGTPYQFRSGITANQELEGEFVVDAGSNNVTLSIDASDWFLNAGLDELKSGALDHRIDDQIKDSLKNKLACHDDDDRDGLDDHGDHGHSHSH